MRQIEQTLRPERRAERVMALLESGQRVTGMSLTLKLFARDLSLPRKYSQHVTPACRAMKRVNELACTQFVFGNVVDQVPALPEGRIHTCPHGLTEIAVPVSRDGVVQGVLLGGPCWCEPTPPPFGDLIVPEDEAWLEDRRKLLLCIASEIGRMLLRAEPSDRRADQVQSFIHRHYNGAVTMEALAKALHLSPSRTRHVVREYFGVSFTELVNAYRLERAAELLETTRLPVGDIAGLVGFCDQAYMTRLFSKRYQKSPTAWRRQNSI